MGNSEDTKDLAQRVEWLESAYIKLHNDNIRLNNLINTEAIRYSDFRKREASTLKAIEFLFKVILKRMCFYETFTEKRKRKLILSRTRNKDKMPS